MISHLFIVSSAVQIFTFTTNLAGFNAIFLLLHDVVAVADLQINGGRGLGGAALVCPRLASLPETKYLGTLTLRASVLVEKIGSLSNGDGDGDGNENVTKQ